MEPQDNFKPGGIIFMRTQMPERLKDFYMKRVGADMWLDQGACQIYKFGNMLFGFCDSEPASMDGVLTFFYPSKKEVDNMYAKFEDRATTSAKKNEKFNIYHFYAEDPEGRSIEFQHFNHSLKAF
ncbi:MAG: hypothetical protein K9I68_11075 [Bacteroidales bacterium]|nr:hypothetical protein [Bacteroidales bacterium]MCF8336470.1 hypothetical protein [Bacteroidales bacterium]